MTEEEAVERMAKIAANPDHEMSHGQGDDLISDFLRAQGFAKLADAFDAAMADWYYS